MSSFKLSVIFYTSFENENLTEKERYEKLTTFSFVTKPPNKEQTSWLKVWKSWASKTARTKVLKRRNWIPWKTSLGFYVTVHTEDGMELP